MILFRDADPFSWVVIGKSRKDVDVDFADYKYDHFDIAFVERCDEFFEDALFLNCCEDDGIAFHQASGVPMQCIILAFWWRISVVAINVLTMMSRAKTLWITGEPRSIRMRHDVIPIVKGFDGPAPSRCEVVTIAHGLDSAFMNSKNARKLGNAHRACSVG